MKGSATIGDIDTKRFACTILFVSYQVAHSVHVLTIYIGYDHMPYLPFPPTWPVYAPSQKVAPPLRLVQLLSVIDSLYSSACKLARILR